MAANHLMVENSKKVADQLRRLACEIERENIENLQVMSLAHYAPVESFGMVVDQRFMGWTMLISTIPLARYFTEQIEALIRGKNLPNETRALVDQEPDKQPKQEGSYGVEALDPNSIIVWRYPAGNEEAKARVLEAISNLQSENKSLHHHLLMPDGEGFSFDVVPLADLRKFRDSLSEIIYDRERAK